MKEIFRREEDRIVVDSLKKKRSPTVYSTTTNNQQSIILKGQGFEKYRLPRYFSFLSLRRISIVVDQQVEVSQ